MQDLITALTVALMAIFIYLLTAALGFVIGYPIGYVVQLITTEYISFQGLGLELWVALVVSIIAIIGG